MFYKIIRSFVPVALISLYISSLAAPAQAADVSAAAPAKWRIMPVGDSITEGGNTFSVYRYPLWKKLTAAGCRFEYVGSKSTPTPDGRLAHEGYGGKNAEFLLKTVPANFNKTPADIVLLHENCEGWGGTSPDNARAFMESVDHPNVRYLFDIGNTVSYGLPTLPFYEAVKPFIAYVHVKDALRNPAGGKSNAFTYPGLGDAQVREILGDLLRTGYTAGVSIEPHVASIVHLGEGTKASPEERFASYVKYGRELESLLQSLG